MKIKTHLEKYLQTALKFALFLGLLLMDSSLLPGEDDSWSMPISDKVSVSVLVTTFLLLPAPTDWCIALAEAHSRQLSILDTGMVLKQVRVMLYVPGGGLKIPISNIR